MFQVSSVKPILSVIFRTDNLSQLSKYYLELRVYTVKPPCLGRGVFDHAYKNDKACDNNATSEDDKTVQVVGTFMKIERSFIL